MINIELKKELDNIFYNKSFLYRGFDKFCEKVKKAKINISQKDLRFYYNNQQVVQMFKPLNKPTKIKILTYKPFRKVYMDTMFITSANITLINTIDYFTKYALIKVYNGNVTNSKKTKEAINNYIDDVYKKGYLIDNVYTDNGSEFKGEFNEYLKDNNINHIFTNPYDKKQTSPIETFNKTVRIIY